MELQFQKTACQYLRRLTGELRSQEQSQELRIPDGMPDIGRLLGSWGQVLLRGKEWNSGSMSVSGGVMVWVLYETEDGNDLQTIEAWLPFQMKWELPQTQHDGVIRVTDYLKSVDARSTSARKLIVRATVDLFGEAFLAEDVQLYMAEELPADIQVLKKTYPMQMVKEAGEHPFELEDTLTLPASTPKLEKLIRFCMMPCINEKKVMTDKVVFRGTSILHVLYRSDDGALYNWDFEVPFSQFSELDNDHDPDAQVQIQPMVTSLELDTDENGQLHLSAGITCQYVIIERTMIPTIEDVYSTTRTVTAQKMMLQLPAVLEDQYKTATAEATVECNGLRGVDVVFYPKQAKSVRRANLTEVELSGNFHTLYYDSDGRIQWMGSKWKDTWEVPAHENSTVDVILTINEVPQCVFSGAEVSLSCPMHMQQRTTAEQNIEMTTMLELGEETQPDPDSPSLILRRFGEDSLWDMAKDCRSTVNAILAANQLTEDPKPGQFLLIPVL